MEQEQASELAPGEAPDSERGPLWRYWVRPGNLLCLAAFALLCVVFLWQASFFWPSTIDDAFITFRFVQNFVDGHGWRYNPASDPVEGFTNFLWAVLLIVPSVLHGDLMLWSKVFGLACGIGAMSASWGLVRAIRRRDDLLNLVPAAFLAVNSHFAHWALMGLETLLQVFLVTACFWRFEVERRDHSRRMVSPWLAVLAAMTRIESLFFLTPLAVYGWTMVFARQARAGWLLKWAAVAALPIVIFWGWKWWYFGDLLPNTYYAKDRMIIFGGDRARARTQLQSFYFRHGEFDWKAPAPPSKEDREAGLLERAQRYVFPVKSPAWTSFWALSALVCGVAMFARRRHGVPECYAAKVGCLVLLPWALNVYYVWKVDADWMPSFRFFIAGLPFIGVAAGVAVGTIADLAARRRAWAAAMVWVAMALTAGMGLFAVAKQQAGIGAVHIYNETFVAWYKREEGWIRKPAHYYSLGFHMPLDEVARFLMLNTQDNTWLFMGDIGMPLWLSPHLNLFDYDGLTDPYLSHAPSRRGDVPRAESFLPEIESQDYWKARPRAEIEKEAKRREFDAFKARNADWLMLDRKPEYVVIFKNHEKPDPASPGWYYPGLMADIARHPKFSEYEEIGAWPKVGNVFNHAFKRKDVPRDVPSALKLQRLKRAIRLNPRMPILYAWLYRESLKMQDITPRERDSIRALVLDGMARWAHDPASGEIANVASEAGDGDVAEGLLKQLIERAPENVVSRRQLAGIYQRRKQWKEAEDVMRPALEYVRGKDTSVHVQLSWLAMIQGRIEDARDWSRKAVAINPDDVRSWYDLANTTESASFDGRRSREERIRLSQEAIGFMKVLIEKNPSDETVLRHRIEEMEGQIESLAPKPAPEPAPVPTPTPQASPTPAPAATPPPGLAVVTGILPRPETAYRTANETGYR